MLKEIQEEINRINVKIEELEKQLGFLKERRKILIDKLSKVAPPCVDDNCGFDDPFYNYICTGKWFECSDYIPAFRYRKEGVL